ncbi:MULTISPECIES: D-tagatose-bisphosphate aldolase, class II, non-catalytic subunit [Agrobacterium]|uniref:D-tagatose-bisphosphate aldolase, class II, non-catalytic subunit n=1 Tax=Agrobacterium rubi TaxID=28099 RepID=A0AAE7RBQ3_9HYPH|nr:MULTISPECIES: D-tagatose-bisphosphate aldolase, class II, non-catalytic subunit [Agrobacterium]MBN7808902.1 D-tagatose-bisphosphate aldolase, class II, non-catalytic subunit [Agrobacterium rosae]NTE90192.1 D-tagatose-bisphosphate aldolase, class II, non-catalytic subunit [Agrobacterium rubi]NTF06011.1 D-tagatose-bisphosphate aldolase, class II, non-catalytic subunit [Agrobacterium rubi]NTF40250.1 D-tagatose-bisphosphate aldolase, class II, non-catalytic subunit [Agrobacterium rubi]OCJ53041.
MSKILTELAASRRSGNPYGITSICSAHPVVLRAALRRAAKRGRPVLIEATCNQVNQFGGYTGMTPADFVAFFEGIAFEEGVRRDQIIFGGDHLGPNPWRKEPAESALKKAADLVEAYVAAGFSKIHLDASMGCLGEPSAPDDETVAARAAGLCAVAERTATRMGVAPPVYVLGTEVPIPGGADHELDVVEPTAPEAARKTIAVHRRAFTKAGLANALHRAIAFVVQPGVEFGSDNVIAYDPARAENLSALLEEETGLVFEAHSTDYQTEAALAALVRDGYPILKVGPGLTFAYREVLYGLDLIASEIVPGYGERSLAKSMEALMQAKPENWKGYYHGDETAQHIQRHFSYSDRIRYYWNEQDAEAAVQRLLTSLNGVHIPKTVLRQYLPNAAPADTQGIELIILNAVVLALYERAAEGVDGAARY